MSDIIYKAESDEIMGACFEVYKEKGSGFLESRVPRTTAIDKNLRRPRKFLARNFKPQRRDDRRVSLEQNLCALCGSAVSLEFPLAAAELRRVFRG